MLMSNQVRWIPLSPPINFYSHISKSVSSQRTPQARPHLRSFQNLHFAGRGTAPSEGRIWPLMLCSHLKCPHSCCTSTLSNGLRQGCSNTESHRHWKGRMVWEVFSWWISSNIPSLANNPMGCLMALVLCLLPAMGSEATCHPCQNS